MDQSQMEKYMRQALRLATKGAGQVAPNPQVAAVIVKDDLVIGQGYHRRYGGPHAEVEAISDCHSKGNNPAGSVMFVTLEPCCHHGKTGPCTEAIAQAGIARVEIATLDEFEQVAGNGAKWLSDHGIDVTVGCCQKEARRLNAGFFKLLKTGQPQVILKWAQSTDGKLAWPSGSRQRWITNEKSRHHVHQLRSRCGAILVGIGTVKADDPLLTVRLAEKKTIQPIRVVLDSKLAMPPESKLAQTTGDTPVIIYTLQATVDKEQEKVKTLNDLGCQVTPLSDHHGWVDLAAVLTDLGSRGLTDLLVEGGPTVLKAFWQQRLADKVMVYIAPVVIGGGEDVPTIDFADELDKLEDVHTQQFDGDTLIEGYV